MYRIDLIMSYGYGVSYLNWLCMSLNLRVWYYQTNGSIDIFPDKLDPFDPVFKKLVWVKAHAIKKTSILEIYRVHFIDGNNKLSNTKRPR